MNEVSKKILNEFERELELLVTKATNRLKQNFPSIQTEFYNGHSYKESIPVITLAEFLIKGGLEPGQNIQLCKFDPESGTYIDTESFWVGDATPYHEPSNKDGGFGWMYDSEICKQYIRRVYEF